MFALLGDIQFDLITYFDGFESQFGANFAEHALIEGKPRLQWIGDNLEEIRIDLAFHVHYCDPEAELAKLKKALAAHEAMALVLGNGDYKGWFVLTEVQATSRHTDKAGTLIALDARMVLREYVGDKAKPRPRPAVQPATPPAEAKSIPTSGLRSTAPAVGASAVRQNIREAVTLANQAQSALRVVGDAVQIARRMRDNPLAALSRVPSVLSGLSRAAGPLAGMSPVLSNITSQVPEAAGIIRSSTSALGAVRDAQTMLAGVEAGNVVGRLDYVGNRLAAAGTSMEAAAPQISKLAGNVVTRRI
jgi:phage protein U